MKPPDRQSAPGYGILGLLLVIGYTLWVRLRPKHRNIPLPLLPDDGIVYLETEDVLVLFADHMGCSVQQARDRLIQPDRLAAALDRPSKHAQYAEADLADQAAVLAQGIVKNHAFDDGNKRTALVVMVNFLKLNGLVIPFGVSQEERDDWMRQLERKQTFEELSARLRTVLVAKQ